MSLYKNSLKTMSLIFVGASGMWAGDIYNPPSAGLTKFLAGNSRLTAEGAKDQLELIDLTHPIPTFEPLRSDPTKPDLSRPVGDSKPIAGFYQQAVIYPLDVWPTNQGHFLSRAVLLQEHNGTSFNSTNHYWNNDESLEEKGVPFDDRLSADQLSIQQLSGPIVFVDVSDRVRRELGKNGGQPSPDLEITDFSNSSKATVRPEDIEAVADQIEDGVWIVARTGWSKFFFTGGSDWNKSVYVNGLNHPGFTPAAIDKIIEIMDRKGVKIAGIAADSLSGDSGEGAKGEDDNWKNSWPAHVRLFQREVLVVESLANLGKLAAAQKDSNCTLIVGALNHVGGTGGPARVVAACQGTS